MLDRHPPSASTLTRSGPAFLAVVVARPRLQLREQSLALAVAVGDAGHFRRQRALCGLLGLVAEVRYGARGDVRDLVLGLVAEVSDLRRDALGDRLDGHRQCGEADAGYGHLLSLPYFRSSL
jgi:hypothetical protein